ncbi:MAG: YigZ family protein [candidate division Zixibacteria bacterium]|nr:YigZ family protein [candidate division Zixibacteria bacterium]
MEDAYYIIAHETSYELKVKGSRFIGECFIVTSTEEAMASLETVRKREHAATHHCFAYRVGLFDDMKFKYSDDGEPSGTAGRPIYDSICGRNLENVLVVVTRYFGGTKLGTGGLARAYSDAAVGVLDKVGRKKNYLTKRYHVEIDFALFDQLTRLLHRYKAHQVKADYSDHVTLEIDIRLTMSEALVKEIVQLSGGKAKIEPL